MGTKQMTPFFSSTFSTLTFIFVFENSKNSFSCGYPFGPLWFVKYLNFGQKLLIQTAHHTFVERRYPEEISKRSQKKLSAHGLNLQKYHLCIDEIYCFSLNILKATQPISKIPGKASKV